jgi:ABC-type branched-subunit amino acid transport system ATPase component
MTVTATAPALLEARGLTKNFGGVRAVQDTSLSIPPKSVFAIIGPNGAGKSTLLNLLSGIIRPDAGTVTFDGADLTHVRAYRRVRHGIARTFQKIRLFKQLSALDNVVAGCHIHTTLAAWQYVLHGPVFRKHQARCREKAAQLLAFMGLAERAHVAAGALSYGERRMLEIARALATSPRLLMVDEPAAGLNAREVETLIERLQKLREDGLTILVVEHNMDLVMTIADRVLVIDYGQYLFEGTPQQVQRHPGVIAAYLGEERT